MDCGRCAASWVSAIALSLQASETMRACCCNVSTSLCLTSRSEGFPNVLLEAMAARVPVIATAVGGVNDLIDDGVTGLLVGADDAVGLAAGLRRLLEQPALVRALTQAARNQDRRVVPHGSDVRSPGGVVCRIALNSFVRGKLPRGV